MRLDILLDDIINKRTSIAVTGLGYVGFPVALSFSRHAKVIGYDHDQEKIERYKEGRCVVGGIGPEITSSSDLIFTSDESDISDAMVHIVTVPTSMAMNSTPDLSLLKDACIAIGKHLREGAVVIFESTVYPGVTESICIPLLEDYSKMKCGENFRVAYSPERINPGDNEHAFETVNKVVSAIDEETLKFVSDLYSLVIKANVYKAPSIKVAEAAKLTENIQRDINIAFINELSKIFHEAGIDTKEVLDAAATKWNFANYRPGLVGGHCIPDNTQYIMHLAETLGYHPELISTGRKVNDEMARYVAENTIKLLALTGRTIRGARVAIFGVTFKENYSDTRNSKAFDIVSELKKYEVESVLFDPVADKEQVEKIHQSNLTANIKNESIDAVIIAVAHKQFREIKIDELDKLYTSGARVLIDVKGFLDKEEYEKQGYLYWRL